MTAAVPAGQERHGLFWCCWCVRGVLNPAAGQGSPESSPRWLCDGWCVLERAMGQEVLLPRRERGAAPGMPVEKREVNLLWRLLLLCQDRRVTQSSVCTLGAPGPAPSAQSAEQCWVGWVLCWELSLLSGKGLGSELASLPRQDSSTSLPRAPSAAQLHVPLRPHGRVHLSGHCHLRLLSPVCPCTGHCCSSDTLLSGYQGLALHCQQLLPGAQPGSDGCRACQAWGLLTPWLWHSHPEGSRTPSGSALSGSPAVSSCPPMCWHCPDLPPGLFHICPGTSLCASPLQPVPSDRSSPVLLLSHCAL